MNEDILFEDFDVTVQQSQDEITFSPVFFFPTCIKVARCSVTSHISYFSKHLNLLWLRWKMS